MIDSEIMLYFDVYTGCYKWFCQNVHFIPLKQNVQASFSNFDTHKSHDIFALIGKNFLAMPLPTGVEYVVSENLCTTTQKGLEIPG